MKLCIFGIPFLPFIGGLGRPRLFKNAVDTRPEVENPLIAPKGGFDVTPSVYDYKFNTEVTQSEPQRLYGSDMGGLCGRE